MNRLSKLYLSLLIAAGPAFGATAVYADSVAMFLPEAFNPRWEAQDSKAFVAKLKELAPDVEVQVFNANNDAAQMQRQAEQALSAGAKVLVVAAASGESGAIIADSAKEEGVPVVSYDRMIESDNTDYWIQASMFGIGESQAKLIVDQTKDGDTLVLLMGSPTDANAREMYDGQMSVLKPLFDAGKRKLGLEAWAPGWDPTHARRAMDQALTALNNNVQGVVAMNDGNAAAAIASLEEQNLAGKVPVSGLDATVQALQLVLLEKQTATIYRPFDEMGSYAAIITSALLQGSVPENIPGKDVENSVGHKVRFVEVPFVEVMGVDGVKYIVDTDPTISKEDVCTGAAATTSYCTE